MQLKSLLGFMAFVISSGVILFISLDIGDINFNVTTLFAHLQQLHTSNHISNPINQIIQLRLNRTLCAFATGGLLALAGSLMQALLRNPLAGPYILGVSGGAAVANLLAMVGGISGYGLTGSAFIGALVTMVLVFGLSGFHRQAVMLRLLLTGVVLAAFFAAIVSLILALSPNRMLHSMLYWLMGDLSYAQFPLLGWLILIFGLGVCFSLARPLNILTRGRLQAQNLGVDSRRLELIIYFLSALLTATAVSLAGNIGFVGLIVPHCTRYLVGSDHRILLPSAVLLGGSLLTLADTVARVVIAPQQLPVGIITALIGVPVFLVLLMNKREATW